MAEDYKIKNEMPANVNTETQKKKMVALAASLSDSSNYQISQ